MIKEALQYIVEAFSVETHFIDGQTYSNQRLHLIPEPTPTTLVVHNLSGLVDYIKGNYDKLANVLIQVESPTEVNVFSSYNGNMDRNRYLQARALLPSIPFERFLDVEEFNILLQSCFVPNDDRAALLQVVGNVKEENVATIGDDGVSQQVTAKAGVATVAPVKVPNPVFLKPYRTFVDIAQPESQFVFRMQKGPVAALFEADGGAWKLDAIHSIRDHLAKELEDQVKSKQVTIIA
ncbi:hypothetical protein [Paenibacillus sp. 32O-W]|uniref:hypothetical protein n=1 Tax=Paenibacillus sp. 32O-W TaxID=1695218 RepID=UPI0011AA6971|nr:hypothetical protein [Paenibacillus sp. 32O-W]